MSTERLDQLRELQSAEPQDTFLRYAIALELRRLGHMIEAIADLEALLTDHPDHVPSYYQLALLLTDVGRVPDAIATCEAGSLQCVVTGDRKARAELLALKETLEDNL